MRDLCRWCACLVAVVGGAAGVARAQTQVAPPPPGLLRVFLDCQFECDDQYLRENVAFVEYVRDRTVAEVHVLVTSQGTGGGGRAWTVKFIGLDRFQDRDRTLAFTTQQTASDDDRRKAFARVFQLGLVWYAADTPAAPALAVTWTRPAASAPGTKPRDPWNAWVFSVGGGGNVNGEESSNNRSLRFNVSGSRTTDAWKIDLSSNVSRNQNTFDLGDDQIVKSVSENWSVNSLVVKSLTAKWSLGTRVSMSHSTFSNNARLVDLSPGIEYDVFPYGEWSRRSLTLRYALGAGLFNYEKPTVFDKLHETVPKHSVNSSIGLRQPWGSLSGSASVSQHLNHRDRYRMSVFGDADVRLFKGFSVNFFGEYERIRDQIGLEKGGASTEDVLLRVRQLATGFSYFFNFNIQYSFGSIFNSTVNPRFGG